MRPEKRPRFKSKSDDTTHTDTFSVINDHSNIQNATFTLKWNVMPHVGLLAYGDEATSGSMAVPKRVPGDKNSKPETIWY